MTGRADTVIRVEDLHVHFRMSRGLLARPAINRAVDGVSFEVARGECVAIVGESGSGKSVTARCILGLEKITSGSISVRGQNVSGASRKELKALRRAVQVVFQDPYASLDPRFSVERTLVEPLRIHGLVTDRDSARRKALDALGRVELRPAADYLHRYPHELSGGQRQRVAIAAALMLEPLVLVADEPTSMLDVSIQAGVLALLRRLKATGLSSVLITHDLHVAAALADRVVVMYLGSVVEVGPIAEVMRDPQHPYTKALVAAIPNLDPRVAPAELSVSGGLVHPGPDHLGCNFSMRCPHRTAECDHDRPSLAAVRGDWSAACINVERPVRSR